MPVCPECGRKYGEGAVGCPDCGVPAEDMEEDAGEEAALKRQEQERGPFWITVVSLLIIPAGLIIWYCCREKAPDCARAAKSGVIMGLIFYLYTIICNYKQFYEILFN